jgi:hypothetical protein
MDIDKNVFRVAKGRENPYAMVANRPVLDTRLSYKARGILWLCLSRPDNWQFNAVYLENMSKSDGRDAVRTGLRELEDAHYIFRTQVQDPTTRQWAGSMWLVFELPYEELYDGIELDAIREMLEAEAQRRFFEPLTGFPSAANPLAENPTLLNTDSVLKTDKTQGDVPEQAPSALDTFFGPQDPATTLPPSAPVNLQDEQARDAYLVSLLQQRAARAEGEPWRRAFDWISHPRQGIERDTLRQVAWVLTQAGVPEPQSDKARGEWRTALPAVYQESGGDFGIIKSAAQEIVKAGLTYWPPHRWHQQVSAVKAQSTVQNSNNGGWQIPG